MEFTVQGQIMNVQQTLEQTIDWGAILMGAPEAWKITKGKGVKVAVLDTGIDTTHPDLLPNLKGGINFTTYNINDFQDRQGHGSHCAGVIAGCDNNVGVVGIAPQASIYAVKVLGDNGSGSLSAITKAIDWCIKAGMDVISMSLGGSSTPPESFHQAFKRAYEAGIAIVVASGNENTKVSYPAAYPETIAVGAIDYFKQKANFSNFGPELDIVAPGVSIYSTVPVGQYGKMSGTSMATPMVAGAIALYIAHKKEQGEPYSIQDIHEAIKESAVDLGLDGYDAQTGFGLLNLNKLLNL